MSAEPIPQLSVNEAWEMLAADSGAVLIDVRTTAEWKFVGLPDIRRLGNELRTVEWTSFPTGASNPSFVAESTNGLDPAQHILLLCRSGARSQAGAELLTANGYPNVHNIAPGFEGPLDGDGHRNGGWKDECPWVQS